MTNDTTPTYRIKPLVWMHTKIGRNERASAACSGTIATVDHERGKGYVWFMQLEDGGWASDGCEPTLDAAKSAAESAYRALVAEHLEEVK